MKTELSKAQQAEWLNNNSATLEHKWSARGMGSSKIIHGGEVIGKAGGCGYDRYGAALGNAIESLFPEQLMALAKRECKVRRNANSKSSENFYGLSLYKGKAGLDGGCGHREMEKVLNKIGFSLNCVGDSSTSNAGSTFYTLEPLTDRDRKYFR